MKMTFPMLIGVLVVLAGVSILLEAVFKIHVPLLRSGFALLLIFLGVRLLIGSWAPRRIDTGATGSAVMSELRFAPTEASPAMKYDVIFGQGHIDLTKLERPAQPSTVEVNVIFGSATVKVDPTWRVAVEATAAFGEVRMPDRSMAAFGTARWDTGLGEPLLRVRINTVFGSCHVLTAPSAVQRPGPISMVVP